MQPQAENDLVYLLIMLESIEKVLIYSVHYDDALQFYNVNDQINFNASLLLLSNIGEQANKISKKTREKHISVKWSQVRGLRNRIVHDYTGIDFEIVFDIIKLELPQLKNRIEELISSELNEGVFSREELEVAASSTYYKHVDFGNI